MKTIAILGRQPAIGRAELESLFGSSAVAAIHDYAAALDVDSAGIPFARIGSTIKCGEILGISDTTDWPKLQRECSRLAVQRAKTLGEGKLQLGISAYGLRITPSQLGGAGLALKKQLRGTGRSVRLIPNNDPALSSAQVLHNHLAGERGLELLLVRSGTTTIIARTSHVQDITAYAHRDQSRPKRDARVGMLPPKLAQTIVNLATAAVMPGAPAAVGRFLLDPFCGTGVILQEAQLMGYNTYGTDLEQRMVDYTAENLAWLRETHDPAPVQHLLSAGDATDFDWKTQETPVGWVASETYLGRPLGTWPNPEQLQDIIMACNTIIDKFMRNLHDQIEPGTRLCLAVPAWVAPNGRIKHLPLLDRLGDLGYNRVSFACANDAELVYHREDQIVGRELLVITRK